MKNHQKEIGRWPIIFLIAYIVIINVLYIFYYPEVLSSAYKGALYPFSYNGAKYILSLFETIVIFFFTIKHIKSNDFSELVMLFLNLLYFIPGAIQQSCTDSEWNYMFFFFLFWIMLEVWIIILRPHSYSNLGAIFRVKDSERYINFMVLLCLVVTSLLLVYNRLSFSLESVIATFADVYGVREVALAKETHWLIVTIEHWVAFFMAIVAAKYVRQKKWLIVFVLVIAELSLFLIQANRIFAFNMLASIGIGLINMDKKKIPFIFTVLALLSVAETVLLEEGLLVTEVFRRFTIVPNKMSECYYDYLLTHEPDFLRSNFNRIVHMLGIPSPYSTNSIETTIGSNYFGWDMIANTGLAGGSFFSFGWLSLIVSTFGYIMAFRLFEGAISRYNRPEIKMSLAVFLTSSAINTRALLANIFGITFIMLLYLSIVPLSTYLNGTKKNQYV